MKKELFAALTLTMLIIGAAYNVFQIKTLSESISEQLSLANQACSIGNYEQAETELSTALELWLQADKYTHIFIRHSEIDSTSDAFYDALSEIQEKSETSVSAIAKIKYHIDSIYAMEKVTLKSVF